MFKKDSNLKSIGIVAKFIGLVLTILTILVNHNPVIFMIFSILFLIWNGTSILSCLTILFSIVNFFFPFTILVKILFLILYMQMFLRIIDFNQYRYFLEKLFYKSGNRFLYGSLKISYFYQDMICNMKEMFHLIKSYGFSFNLKLFSFLVKESYLKSKNNVSKTMKIYKYRFYGLKDKKTYLEEEGMDSYDFKYILTYVLILLIVYIYRS